MCGLTCRLFRQTLPVILRSTPTDKLNLCIKASYLGKHIIKKTLTVDMRLAVLNDIQLKHLQFNFSKSEKGN